MKCILGCTTYPIVGIIRLVKGCNPFNSQFNFKKILILTFASFAFVGVNAQAIDVTAPDGGQTLYTGKTTNITWTSSNISSFVKIEFSTDNGSNWLLIAGGVNNTGSYSWIIPDNISENCLVRVSDFNDDSVNDVSNAVFTIKHPFINISSPNGGESLEGCSQHAITWTSGGVNNYARIFYSPDGGAKWTYIAQPYIGSGGSHSYNWAVPAIASSNYKIKIIDYYDSGINDESDAEFSVTQPADYLSLTSPNGGESWSSSSVKTISWTSIGSVGNVSLKYSTDGGNNWDWVRNSSGQVANNIANTGSFEWLVPSTQSSSSSLVQIYEYNKPCNIDITDNLFTIDSNPAITVISPNGGEEWYVDRTYTVSWSASNLPTTYVSIDYSIDNGQTWLEVISSTYNNGSYGWKIPNNVSSQCLIRVKARDNHAISDISEANFTIAPPFITLTSPNGGEVITGCSTHQITWNQEGLQNYVRIYYSVDGGSNWIHVANPYVGTNTYYNWTVPSVATDRFRVKVEDYYNAAVKDSSDANFTVTQGTDYLTLNSPNGGEVWAASSAQNITWNTTGTVGNVSLRYSTNGGVSWDWVRNSGGTAANNIANTGSYEWLLPSNVVSSNCMLQLYEYSKSCVIDYSDSTFTIDDSPTITVTSPSGGEKYYVDRSYTIRWSASNLPSTYVAIDYSTDNGLTWLEVSSSQYNNGSYNWKIPNTITTEGLIRIKARDDSSIFGISNAFTIAQPYITLTSPNGGETWPGCTQNQITWNQEGLQNYVRIYYSVDGGNNWIHVANPYVGTNTYYNWTVPSVATDRFRVKVEDYYNAAVKDSSDANFTVTQGTDYLTLISPNGLEEFSSSTLQTINWTTTGTIGNVSLRYSTNGGASWDWVRNNAGTAANNIANTGSYEWLLPSNLVSSKCLIQIYEYSNSCRVDFSDDFFTINNDPVLTVTAPLPGETYYFGETKTIRWSSSNLPNNYVKLEYSLADSVWQVISESQYNNGSYSWVVPAEASTAAFIRVSVVSYPEISDTNDEPFTIKTPEIKVTNPNTGDENWLVGENKNITWTTKGLASTALVKIEYSANSGETWSSITESVSNSGSYIWTIPNISTSSQSYVKVSSLTYSASKDSNDFAFTITKPIVGVTVPNDGQVWYVGESKSIQWSGMGTTEYVKIELSSDSGKTYSPIIASTANTGQYFWTIPYTTSPSTACYIKISDVLDPVNSDSSDVPFTIAKPVVTLTAPNGGENWYMGQIKRISWNNVGMSSSKIKIEYSADTSSTWSLVALVNNEGYYDWNIPSSVIPSEEAFIRISDENDFSINDLNDQAFTMKKPSVSITSPNGGEVIYQGQNKLITWKKDGAYSPNVRIDYSADSASTWNLIAEAVVNNESFSWAVPSSLVPGNKYILRIRDAVDSTIVDYSDAVFTVSKPTITVKTPNGGEIFYTGTSRTIQWNSQGLTSSRKVNISLSHDNGSTWSLITSEADNTGSYSWALPPETVPGDYLININDVLDETIQDVSDDVFKILKPVITVVSPNGGEKWHWGQVKSITWHSTALPSSGSVKIEYSSDGGSSWNSITASTLNSGAYNWTVPSNITMEQVLVRITSLSQTSVFDTSDSPFSIREPRAGDAFETAVPLASLPHTFSDTTSFHSDQFTGTGNQPSGDIFYSFTIPEISDSVSLSIVANFQALMHILSSKDVLLGSSKAGTNYTYGLSSLTPGNTYYLVVEGNNTSSGNFRLSINNHDPAPDLNVKNVTADHTFIAPGELVTVFWDVENVGEGTSEIDWTERIYMQTADGLNKTLLKQDVFSNSDSLISGQVLSRSREITIPTQLNITDQGVFVVELIPGPTIQEIAGGTANNIAVQETPWTVRKVLTLELSASEITEGTAGIIAKVSRTGSLLDTLIIIFNPDSPERFSFPSEVNIPAGKASTTFAISAPANEVIEGNITDTLRVSATGFVGAKAAITILDNKKPTLSITNLPSNVMEGTSLSFKITTDITPAEPLEVFLTSSSQTRFPLPPSVIIPADSNSVNVTVNLEQDDIPEVDLEVTIKAGASNHHAASTTIPVKDDDVPGLELIIHNNIIPESGGPYATEATLRRTDKTNTRAFKANLSASLANTLILPASIPLAEGELEKNFTIGVVENSMVDGDRQIMISASVFVSSCGCDAPSTSSGSVSTSLTVTDNDGPTLTLNASSLTLPEGYPNAGQLRITRNTPTDTELSVNLSSSDEKEATVPATIVIPLDKAFVDVPVTTINDNVTDGNKQVYFHATAGGFSTGSVWVMVTDQNLPDLQLPSISVSNATVQAKSLFNYNIAVKNSGFATAPTGVVVHGYLSKDNVIDASDSIISQDVVSVSIPAGETHEIQNAVRAPNRPGEYKLLYWVNPESRMTELLSTNNKSTPLAFKINPDYTATANVSNEFFLKGDPVLVSGAATRFDGTAAANVKVEVYVITNGFRRTVLATTDASGNYSTEFIPLANEAGYYTIGASFPGMDATAEQDNFNILGLRISNGQIPKFHVILDDTLTGSLPISNLSSRSLTEFTMVPVTLPNGAQMLFDTVAAFAGNTTINLPYTVTGSALSPGTNFEVAGLKAISGEGTIQNQDVFYFCQAPKAYIAADVNKLDVLASSAKGERQVEIKIMNKGDGVTGRVSVGLPQVNWLTSVTPRELPSMDSGDTTTVILKFFALEEVPFEYPIKGNIIISTQNGNNLTVPFNFKKVSESTGDVAVTVTNQFTYYSEDAPKVKDAHVKVQNYFSGVVYAEGNTDSTGIFIATGIPEGKHRIVVEKEKHLPYNSTITINPGATTEASVFLNYQAITFSWSVVPTAVEDQYDITLVADFETHIPVPVVTIDMPKVMPQLSGSEIYAFNITLTNHGLITAKDVALNLPTSDPEYEFVMNYQPADLLAQQAIQVPVVMRRRDSADAAGRTSGEGSSIEAISKFLGMDEEQYRTMSGESLGCSDFVGVVYWYKCNISTGLWQKGGVLFSFEGRSCPSSGGGSGGGVDPSVWAAYANAYPTCALCPNPDIWKGDPNWTNPYKTEKKSCVECINDMIGAGAGCASGGLAQGVGAASCVAGNYLGGGGATGLVNCVPLPIPGPIGCAMGIGGAMKTCLSTSSSGRMSAEGIAQRLASEPELGAVFQQIYDNLQVVIDAYQAREDWSKEYFGSMINSDAFMDLAPELEPYVSNLDSIHSAEQSSILNVMQGYEIPSSAIEQFFTRWNTSIYARSQGILEPTPEYPDIIDWVLVQGYSDIIVDRHNKAIELGYESLIDMYEKEDAALNEILDAQQQAVCATVKVQFSQTLTMTREAFEGTLDIFNGHPTDAMDSLSVHIQITDASGAPGNGLFEIQTKSLTNLSDISGAGIIASQQNGIVKFLFIPELGAAPTEPKNYNFGGYVRYWDPYAQSIVTMPLADVQLTVNPSPNLMLHYFMQRNILGDDALTKDVIEPSVPAELAVMVENQGYGPAVNMVISSAQPEIIENEKGLAINFLIVGSNFQGQPKNLGVTDINFGTIPALQARIGQWYFTSSLLGKFVSYEASVVHANSFGNPELSLVKDIKLHELTKSIRAYGPAEDGINDFLVNDVFDIHDVPDIIYFSQGNRTAEVVPAKEGNFSSAISAPSFTNTLTVSASDSAWNYIKLNDPGNGRYDIESITRSDGQIIPPDNAWLTFVTLPVSNPPVYENKFHFVDEFASLDPVTYTVVWKPRNLNVPKIISIEGVPEEVTTEQVQNIIVKFNKSIDTATFTYADLNLTFQGGPNIIDNSVAITQLDSATFNIDISTLTTGNGFYNLTVQAAGVQDIYGINGLDGKQATWSQFMTVPAVQAFYGIPEGNIASAFDTIQVLFNLPIDESTVSPDRFYILRDSVIQSGTLTIDSVREDKKLFYLSGLSNILIDSGTYNLVVDLPNIKSEDQVSGMKEQSITLILDNRGPQVLSIKKSNTDGLDSQHVTFVDIQFDENVKGFNTASVRLTRDGEVQHLNIDQLSNTDLKNWFAGNFGMLTYPEGDYKFTLNSAGFTDAIGNYGIGTQEISWTVNRSAVVTISDLAVSPDLGFSNTDGITSEKSLDISFILSDDASQITISQVDLSGEAVLTEVSDVSAGAVSIPVTILTGGRTGIKVTATGVNGGVGVAEKAFFIDQSPLSARWLLKAGQIIKTQVDTVLISFNSKLLSDEGFLNAIQFKRDGTTVSTDGVSFEMLNDTTYSIYGIRDASSLPGEYQLIFNLQPFSKYSSGIGGTGLASVSWTVESSNQAPIAIAGEDITITATGVVVLDGSSSYDSDSNQISYQWIAPEGITLSDSLSANPSFNIALSDHGKTYSFLLIVGDGSLFSTDVVDIKIDLADYKGIVLLGKVNLQGRQEAPNESWKVPLTIDLYQAGETTPAASYQMVVDSVGGFSLENMAVATGDYVVTVKNGHTLKAARAANLQLGNNLVDFGELKEGDANDDNSVKIVDFSILSATFNKPEGAEGYDDRADFNENKQVTLLDFSLLSGNFNQNGYVVSDTSFTELLKLNGKLGNMSDMFSTSMVFLELEKPDHVLQKNEEFTVPVLLHAGEQEIDGAEIHLEFDPDILQVTGITPGEDLPVELLNNFDNKGGKIDFAAGAFEKLPKGDLVLLHITFKVVNVTTETPINFTSSYPGETIVTYKGKPVLGGFVNGVIDISKILGCEDCTEDKILIAYPNPTRGKFSISANGFNGENGTIIIVALNGTVVQKQSVDLSTRNIIDVDITDQPAGIYLIVLEIGASTTIHRIQKI